MIKKIVITFSINLLCVIHLFAQQPLELRSFDDIFPDISSTIRSAAFSDSGYYKSSEKKYGFDIVGSHNTANLDSQIINTVLVKNPLYLTESIFVIPAETVSLLDVYNALGNIRGLKGRLYDSHTRGQTVPLFEDATRIAGERQLTPIPDPPPVVTLPRTDTIFIRLRDTNFGNTYYRCEMSLVQNGLRYTMTNFRNMTYLLIPVIREEKFIAQLYIEPVKEGVLIYSIAGADVSDFFASRIDINSAIAKRLMVIISWAADGIIK